MVLTLIMMMVCTVNKEYVLEKYYILIRIIHTV